MTGKKGNTRGKGLLLTLFFIIFGIAFSETEIEKEQRVLYQPMEETSFERAKEEGKTEEEIKKEKIQEAFEQGKARIDFMKERELHLLDLETKAGLDRKKEIETLDAKYNTILEKYAAVKTEQEILLTENEMYKEYLERLRNLEELLYNQQNKEQ